MFLNKIFYHLKPIIPRRFQILVRQQVIRRKRIIYKDIWPIDENAHTLPHGWLGWPDKKQFALVLTHDVERATGQQKCLDLIRIEEKLGFQSSFNFVPKNYKVSDELRDYLVKKGFEVGVHGLYHDGKLYASKKIFQECAIQINHYLREWKSVGFRSPSMHRNLDWMHDLHIKYDSSTFDTDPFEPQPDGMGTIFPFWVSRNSSHHGYVELPYTLPQDFTLFILMKEKNIDIWKKKLDWIAEKGGMALLNTHPDYMNFNGKNMGIEEFPAQFYKNFLEYVKSEYEGHYWHVLPKDMARYWSGNFVENQKITKEEDPDIMKYETITNKELTV